MYSMLIVFCVILFWLWKDTIKPARFPPGPSWWPILGNMLSFYRHVNALYYHHLVWKVLANKYGPVVGLRLGANRVIVVSGREAVKEACSKEEFDGRPDGFFFRMRTFGERLGVVFTDGPLWAEQRRFSVNTLRSLGLGRRSMEMLIAEEAFQHMQDLRRRCSEPIFMHDAFDVPVLNVLWAMLAGKRFDLDDSRLMRLMQFVHASFRISDMSGGLLNHVPALRHVAPRLCGYRQLCDDLEGLYGFLKETIDEHRKTMDPNNQRDVIDAYLQEIDSKRNKNSSFTEKQLLSVCLDMFQAGSETTSNSLGFVVLFLILHPDVQKRARDRIDAVVGRDRLPTLQDRPKYALRLSITNGCLSLGYIEAVILEVQRFANIVPTAVGHRAMQDVEFMGYFVPKDTIVLLSLYSINMDREHLGDPDVFRPERFLQDADPAGKLLSDEWLVPFGMGKRRCLGEVLARSSMFLFLTSLLHNFTLSSEKGATPDHRGLQGVTLSPRRFKAILTPRD